MVRATAAVAVLGAVLLFASGASATTSATTYTVAFKTSALPTNIDKLITDAGGTIVARLPEIGGLGVRSSNPSFATRIESLTSVASAEKSVETALPPTQDSTGSIDKAGSARQSGESRRRSDAPGIGTDPQPEPDSLGSQQWDKMRMNVSSTGSYAINRGRPEVRVAFTDTGVDQLHPDIAPNLDLADSRSFVEGDPTIQDYNGHGTWVASAVAAPINTIGISGVAPQVSIVALKTQAPGGGGFQFSIDQALIYSGQKGFDIVSSSIIFYAETCQGMPPGSGCDNADYVLAQRAVDYARSRGVTIVGALGNDDVDVGDRKALGALFGVPDPVAELIGGLDGVIGVSSTGYNNEKAFYSNYGLGAAADVTAPGGDPLFQQAPAPYIGKGRVLGAWTSTPLVPGPPTVNECVGSVCGLYAWIYGTSMAAPNAAGVAALIISRYGNFDEQHGDNNGDNGNGNNRNNGNNKGTHMRPDKVEKILKATASAIPCPNPATVVYPLPEGFPFEGLTEATCQGTPRYNSFYGAGLVNAVAALTRGGGDN